jgi:hypothetical protein
MNIIFQPFNQATKDIETKKKNSKKNRKELKKG